MNNSAGDASNSASGTKTVAHNSDEFGVAHKARIT